MGQDKYLIRYDWKEYPSKKGWGYYQCDSSNWLIIFILMWIKVNIKYDIYDVEVRRVK